MLEAPIIFKLKQFHVYTGKEIERRKKQKFLIPAVWASHIRGSKKYTKETPSKQSENKK